LILLQLHKQLFHVVYGTRFRRLCHLMINRFYILQLDSKTKCFEQVTHAVYNDTFSMAENYPRNYTPHENGFFGLDSQPVEVL